jgi:uncharacterized protein YjiK
MRIKFLLLLSLSTAACAQQNQQTTASLLADYFLEVQRQTFSLPDDLNEISGLAMTSDFRLFGHNDERGIVYQIDYTSGNIIKKFQVGDKKIKEDFEGIAIIDEDFFLVTSSGDLYRFHEGENHDEVKYSRFKTDLSSKYNVEGLCYDPKTKDLLLACKGYPGKEFKDKKAVYAVSSLTLEMIPDPRFLVKESDVITEDEYSLIRKIGKFFLLPTQRTFSPSGIAFNPRSKSFFILSAHDPMIVEVSASGVILGVVELDKSVHKQPEGIEFTADLSLIIADEAVKGHAQLSIYKLGSSE